MAVCWIETVPVAEATGRLRKTYKQVLTPHGTVDNVYQAQSLRPHTMHAHDVLYRSVLHHQDNTLPDWFLESVAVYTSMLNRCEYAVAHHARNVCRLIGDEDRFQSVQTALSSGRLDSVFSIKEVALLRYTEKLTLQSNRVSPEDIETLRRAGAADGEILEVNQVCACFNYANRVINGLGVDLGDDMVGFYV